MVKTRLSWSETIKFITYSLSIGLILFVFFSNRSLFLDSLNLARNIAEGSFSDLCIPLNYEQSAPILFLFISKAITIVLGISEYTLRLLPLLAGLGCLFLFGNVLDRLLKSHYVILGILWLGTHATFLRYATEFKQYMSDAFISILLIWLALRIDEINNKNLVVIALIGSVGIWTSMPAIFGLLGILAFYFHIHHKQNKSKLPIYILFIWFAINFVFEYFLILKPAIQSDQMQNFHQNYFLQGTFWNFDSLKHDFGLVISTIRLSVGKSGLTIGLAILLICYSVYSFIRRRKSIGLLIVIPILAVFGASLIGKYSLVERLMIFTMPLIFLLILIGLQQVEENIKGQSKWMKYTIMGIFGLAFIVGFNQTQGLHFLSHSFEIEDNRTSLIHINQHQNNSNSIICSQFAFPAYEYYTKHDKNYKGLDIGQAKAAHYSDNLVRLAINQNKEDNKDVWILLGHLRESEITKLLKDFENAGTIKNSYRTNCSAAILFSTQ